MKRLLATGAVLMVALTGCAVNHDPRQGEVTLKRSNCLFGDCKGLGPGLHIVYDSSYRADMNFNHVTKNARECK